VRGSETLRQWRRLITLGLLASIAGASLAAAQPGDQRRPDTPPNAACPPDVKGLPPTVGGPASSDLSDRLADSKGVICPPAGVDPQMHVPAPQGGEMNVIPPPGTPGGNRNIEPK
jgi:hypothetical protein